jgi:glycosyltransferase involved in cell wall biosynthesis
MKKITVPLAIQQRVLPSYRVAFFDALAAECAQGLHLIAGQARQEESLDCNAIPTSASFTKTTNIHLLRGKCYLCWQMGLIAWLSRVRPDVLILEANPRYLSSYSAIRWMKARGKKVIGWGLGSPSSNAGWSSLRISWRKKFVQQFDCLITYSRKGAEEYARLGIPKEKIFTAPNAAVHRPQQAAPNRPNQFIGDKAVVLFVGRLQERKRVDDLIRACAALPIEMQPILWVIGDGPMRMELESLAKEIYPQAVFFGAMHGSELDRQFIRADLFVLPGTGGLAVQQAMSFGLPVIVAQADGTQADLVRPENGWSLLSGSSVSLTQALQVALSNPAALRKMGMESYRIVKDEINLENMVQAFVLAINSVAGKSQ